MTPRPLVNYVLNFLKLLCNRYIFPNKVFSLLIARLSIYHIASLAQERVKGNRVIFRPCPVSEIPGGSKNSQSCDADSGHVHSTSGLTRIFILHENIHVTRVVTLSAEELSIMSKNNLKGITLERMPKWGTATFNPLSPNAAKCYVSSHEYLPLCFFEIKYFKF